MVNVISENLEDKITKLPKRLQKEWFMVIRYHSKKNILQVFEDFKKRYDNFEGNSIEEFLAIPNVLFDEWEDWKYKQKYITDFKTKKNKMIDTQVIEKTLSEVINEFKELWQYNSEETNIMFKEMELLSKNMMYEWKLKYNFEFPHVYEKDNNHFTCVQRNYHLKSKAQLWKEFKEIWNIDISDYNEEKYNEMTNYINEIECNLEDYFKDYPRNFLDFLEDSNYHSFDSYSILEQFEICRYWERQCEDRDIEESSSDEDEDED